MRRLLLTVFASFALAATEADADFIVLRGPAIPIGGSSFSSGFFGSGFNRFSNTGFNRFSNSGGGAFIPLGSDRSALFGSSLRRLFDPSLFDATSPFQNGQPLNDSSFRREGSGFIPSSPSRTPRSLRFF